MATSRSRCPSASSYSTHSNAAVKFSQRRGCPVTLFPWPDSWGCVLVACPTTPSWGAQSTRHSIRAEECCSAKSNIHCSHFVFLGYLSARTQMADDEDMYIFYPVVCKLSRPWLRTQQMRSKIAFDLRGTRSTERCARTARPPLYFIIKASITRYLTCIKCFRRQNHVQWLDLLTALFF